MKTQFEMCALLQRKTKQSLKICNKITLGLFRNKEFNGYKISNQHDDNNANNNLGATWRKLSWNKFQSNIIQSFWELQIFSDRFPYAWPQTT